MGRHTTRPATLRDTRWLWVAGAFISGLIVAAAISTAYDENVGTAGAPVSTVPEAGNTHIKPPVLPRRPPANPGSPVQLPAPADAPDYRSAADAAPATTIVARTKPKPAPRARRTA